MSDYHRVYVSGGCYFFTVVCRQRRTFLADAATVDLLRQAIRSVKTKQPFEIDGMVVLPDHLHCIWRLPENDSDFSSRWREIKKYVTRRLALTLSNGQTSVWQSRFWEHLIRDEEDWRRHMDYIHYNPVKHGLVHHPADWPYSSFRTAVQKGWYDSHWGDRCPDNIEAMDIE